MQTEVNQKQKVEGGMNVAPQAMNHDGAPNAVLWQRQEAALPDFIGARGAQLACKTNHSVKGGADGRQCGAVLRHCGA